MQTEGQIQNLKLIELGDYMKYNKVIYSPRRF